MHGPAEIGDFELTLDADEQVLRLDVAVNHVLLVAIEQRLGEGRDTSPGATLAKPLALLELLVQLSACGVLQDEVHAILGESGDRQGQRRVEGGSSEVGGNGGEK